MLTFLVHQFYDLLHAQTLLKLKFSSAHTLMNMPQRRYDAEHELNNPMITSNKVF